MAIQMKGQLSPVQVRDMQAYFVSTQAIRPEDRTLEAHQLMEAFSQAGISRVEQIGEGESISKLIEATGKQVDDLMQMMRKCPFGKKMPTVGG